MARTDLWTREQTILACNLYFKTPYGRMHGGNLDIQELAKIVDRKPGGVGRKLQNIASLDPVQQARGIKGLSHASNLDREIFNEFVNDWESLALESERILAEKQHVTLEEKIEFEESEWQSKNGKDVMRTVKTRIGQGFFRSAVLTNFDSRCAISGINIPEMLRASHIVPWAKDEKARVNPENGLCLSALYDAAFDKGFIGVNTNYRIILAEKMKKKKKEFFYHEHFGKLDGIEIRPPSKFFPRKDFLEYHLDEIFDK
ncbi:HNH endonuclease [Spirosoma spitsbergense]|uniref:HNH endonuclease n=1 Tax=Spirosoma spitsbergense TaxID=431554 RepID=UPI0003807785|nr:HNH endonuclease signature motif containing protein [Spirosoma spitsbergense]